MVGRRRAVTDTDPEQQVRDWRLRTDVLAEDGKCVMSGETMAETIDLAGAHRHIAPGNRAMTLSAVATSTLVGDDVPESGNGLVFGPSRSPGKARIEPSQGAGDRRSWSFPTQ